MAVHTPCICGYYEAPKFDKGNGYILRGYRVNFTRVQCLKSIFMLSNETINIWSHLFGVLWFLSAVIDVNINILPGYKLSTVYDHVIITLFCISLLLCFLFSTLFHVLRCHSEWDFHFWYKLDLLGIGSIMIASCMTGMYYSFSCFPLLRAFYMITFIVLLLLNLYIQMCMGSTNAGIDIKAIFGFSAVMSFTFLPAIHWFIISGGLKSNVSCTAFVNLLVTYAMAGVGLFVYLTRFPEKWFPCYFDYVGASHQIWHFLILFAVMWWYSSCFYFIDLKLSGFIRCQDY